jgi:ribosomal protein S21
VEKNDIMFRVEIEGGTGGAGYAERAKVMASRFKRLVDDSGILSEWKQRQRFESKSQKKRRKKKQAEIERQKEKRREYFGNSRG